MSAQLFINTPSVTVLDNRGLPVREVEYHRHPDTPANCHERIIRHQFDRRGFLLRSADPRLGKTGLVNLEQVASITGAILLSANVDAGTTAALTDNVGRPLITINNIRTPTGDIKDGSQRQLRTWRYEEAQLPGRPLSVEEHAAGDTARIAERFVYAGYRTEEQDLNVAGHCIRHYETAGLAQTESISLTGVPLCVSRRLPTHADQPDFEADWHGEDARLWDEQLATERFSTLYTVDATASLLRTMDTLGNAQNSAYDVSGTPSHSQLILKDQAERAIVKACTYSANGLTLLEEHGNGTVTTYTYAPQTQRVIGIKTERPGKKHNATAKLQDLRYTYDPAGNVLNCQHATDETHFWRNQVITPEDRYTYDSLYQLVRATGREQASAGRQGSRMPNAALPTPADNSPLTNYTRLYTYDSAGNLTQIRHFAAFTGNQYTIDITLSNRSNRGVPDSLTSDPETVETLFLAGGQQRWLQPGQHLTWTLRNELLKVAPVVRDGSEDDQEFYRYDSSGQRLMKLSTQKVRGSTQARQVLYLPTLELRSFNDNESAKENLHVIRALTSARTQAHALHWENGKPSGIENNQVRWSYQDLAGNSTLELDDSGNIISREGYYPYGGTATFLARNSLEADYKTIRYSGKERDATGLYYYGYRYYQLWAGRWLSADPAGTIDGLNLFRMARNNPITYRDADGLSPSDTSRMDSPDTPQPWDFSRSPMPDAPTPQKYRFIVHTAPVEHLINRTGIFSKDANEQLKSWDAVSASLITESKSFTYRSFGAILAVPPQNILAAHHEDLMSELNVGRTDRVDYLVRTADRQAERSRLSNASSVERNGMLAREISHHQHRQSTPEEIIRRTDQTRNELIIATRPSVNVTKGLPVTGEVRIVGYFLITTPHNPYAMAVPPAGSEALTPKDNAALAETHAQGIARQAGVPFYLLKGQADVFDYMSSSALEQLHQRKVRPRAL